MQVIDIEERDANFRKNARMNVLLQYRNGTKEKIIY